MSGLTADLLKLVIAKLIGSMLSLTQNLGVCIEWLPSSTASFLNGGAVDAFVIDVFAARGAKKGYIPAEHDIYAKTAAAERLTPWRGVPCLCYVCRGVLFMFLISQCLSGSQLLMCQLFPRKQHVTTSITKCT